MLNDTPDVTRPRAVWIAVRVTALALLLATGTLLAIGLVDSDEGLAILVVFGVAALVVVATPEMARSLASRVQKVSIGPLAVELLGEAKSAADEANLVTDPALVPSDNADDEDDPVLDLVELRLKLEAKLTYIAQHVLGARGDIDYVTIGSLRRDRLITTAQARTAAQVLTLDEGQFANLDRGQQRAFLQDASAFTRNMRAQVLHAHVRRLLQQYADEVHDIDRGPGKRVDFRVRKNERWLRVAVTFALSWESKALEATTRRLGSRRAVDPGGEVPLVVIPALRGQRVEVRDPVWIVSVAHLEAALNGLA